MEAPIRFVFESSSVLSDIERDIAPRYALRETRPEAARRQHTGAAAAERTDGTARTLTFRDTFDWRLFNAGYLLYEEGGEEGGVSHLLGPSGIDTAVDTTAAASASQPPPDSFASLLGIRALVTVCTARVSERRFRVEDDIGKTIARLVMWTPGYGDAPRFPATAVLTPLKGYAAEARTVARALAGQAREVSFTEYAGSLLAAGGREPGAYSSKVTLALEPDMPAQAAGRAVLGYFLEVMRENETGIAERVDTEHLHDYRVALRRLRSFIAETKGAFASERTQAIKDDLKSIQDRTGEARDLDVLLLHRDDYRALLPDKLASGLEAYFGRIRERREAAYDALIEYLRGPAYEQTMQGLRTYAAHEELEPAERAEEPIGELAGRRMQKRMKRVASGIDAAMADPQDELLHRLRIDGKKLRYLLEITASLYPAKKSNRLIKQLKKFQDSLGRLHDVAVQEQTLGRDLETIRSEDSANVDTAAAIGGLLTRIRGRRPEIFEAFINAAETYRSQIGRR